MCGSFARSSDMGVIRGVARDASTSHPLAEVSVVAVSPSGRYQAITDATGRYALLEVLPDTYALTFSKSGFGGESVPGITVLAGSTQTYDVRLSSTLRTIASVKSKSRSVGSAFQPGMTADTYTVTDRQIALVQGKAFNSDENQLLRSIPSVTIDKSGTVSIRGGFAFEAGYEYEGIDYTVPTPNLQNTLQNIGNFNLLNGVGGVELIPGGGDATHGNAGTGLVLLTAKHGTFPAYARADVETFVFPYLHQVGLEYGWADPHSRLSNYASFLGVRRDYQYGPRDAAANALGSRGTNAASLGSQIDPNLVYYSPQYLASNDLLDNLIWRFGRDLKQRLQVFVQRQDIRQDLDYGGYQALHYSSGGSAQGSEVGTCAEYPPPGSDTSVNSSTQNAACSVLPLYPGQPAPWSYVSQPDRLHSPFLAYKLEYADSRIRDTLITARFFRTFAQQIQELPSQGILASPFGGMRTGTTLDVVTARGEKHLIKAGLSYEFSRPFGDRFDATSYTAFTAEPQYVTYPLTHGGAAPPIGSVPPAYNPISARPGSLELDFFSASQCAALNAQFATPVPCGYLNSYFPNGVRMPVEHDAPTVAQQMYGAYVQDDVTFSSRWKSELGLRLDGFNFLVPVDPSDPPGIAGVAHQRLYEPHVGLTLTAGQHDVFRMGYGRTLDVPLPSQLGANVMRAAYAAFSHVPSYDSSTGLPAAYCGVTAAQTCANYADQLHWLTRDYRYGSQPLNAPLRGATFTNVDLSWAHEFRDGSALKLTPFYRRGYDVIQQTAQLVGFNPDTGAPIAGDFSYSNLGQQRATGAEVLYTKDRAFGLSVQIGATYINQFGNEPPGSFLLPAALAAGVLYRSPDLSPFQLNAALQYKTAQGVRINPVIAVNAGYPYGAGYYTAIFCGGHALVVPSTDVNTFFANAPTYVDPENPGTCARPNIAATRGVRESPLAGGLLSRPRVNADLTIEYQRPGSPTVFGVQFHNLTNSIYNVPTFNSCYGVPVSTGVHYSTAPCAFGRPQYANPGAAASFGSAYAIYPNQEPLTIRLYTQVRL